jgi:hypothetical protein
MPCPTDDARADYQVVHMLRGFVAEQRQRIARLSPAERRDLERRMMGAFGLTATSADGHRVRAYAIHLALGTATNPPPSQHQARSSAIAGPQPVLPAAPFAMPQMTRAHVTSASFTSDTIARLRQLTEWAGSDGARRQTAAIASADLLRDATSAVLRYAPERAEAFASALAGINSPARFLPAVPRTGWYYVAMNGRLVGSVRNDALGNQRPGRFEARLHDVNQRAQSAQMGAFVVKYEFTCSLDVPASDFVRRILARHQWSQSVGFPAAADPYDLTAVARHFQAMSSSGTSATVLLQRWRDYANAYIQWAGPTDILGSDAGHRTQNMAPSIYRHAAVSGTGEKLIDCDGIAAMGRYVFANIRTASGQPRFRAAWVHMPGHMELVVVERRPGGAWALFSNEDIVASGHRRADESVALVIGRAVDERRPTIYGVDYDFERIMWGYNNWRNDSRATQYLYTGHGTRVASETDRRALRVHQEMLGWSAGAESWAAWAQTWSRFVPPVQSSRSGITLR